MSKIKPLTPAQARGTLAHRLTRLGRLFQINTRLGVRPYRCFLVYVKWPGSERGEGGNPVVVSEQEILPTPLVEDLDQLKFRLQHAGTIPEGSLRISEIHGGTYTRDMLMGLMVPVPHQDSVPSPYDFFWEVAEDGRGDDPPQRQRFRVMGNPTRRADRIDWVVMLERVSEDRNREKQFRYGTGEQG